MDTSDADWGGWNMDGQSGEIDEMIAAYEHEQESQPPDGVGSLGNSTDGKLQPLGDSTNTISVEAEMEDEDIGMYDEETEDYNSLDENSVGGSDEDCDSEESIEEELLKINQSNGFMNGTADKQSATAKCEYCGTIGMRPTFFSKSKRFCSLSCSQSATAGGPRGDKYHITLKDNSSNNLQNKRVKAPSKKPKLSNKAKQQLKNSPASFNAQNSNKSFDWSSYLNQTNGQAAPVSCFKHCPMSDGWDNITVGMKVEVQNFDCELPNNVYWIATVVKIAGYRALLRYEGFSSDASHDFWINLCTQDVHPVGWCATSGKPLVPPKTIQNKYSDWKDFLVKRLTGARTLPNNFYNKVVESITNISLKSGMKVEVVDKMCVSAMRVASVDEIIGGRLRLQYVDSMDENDDFWCHMQSSLVHHVGWSQIVGHKLHASADYKTNSYNKATTQLYSDNESTPHMFPKYDYEPPESASMSFKEGMKLEAIDPLSLASICVATVKKVLRNNYLMIGIDGSIAANGSDWFCYHASSPCIFPVGFCEINSLDLTPPRGHKGSFNWFDYLRQTKSIAAPVKLFDKEIPKHGFKVGMKLEAVDLMEPRLICVGTVTKVVGRLLRIHFDGWDQAYDQWIDCRSPDIYPVGWCEMVGYHLEGPRSGEAFSPIAPPVSIKKRKTKNQMYRGPRRKKRKSKGPGGKPGPKLEGARTTSNGMPLLSLLPSNEVPRSIPDLSTESSQSPLSVETSASSSIGVKLEKVTNSSEIRPGSVTDMPTLSPPIPALVPVQAVNTKSTKLSPPMNTAVAPSASDTGHNKVTVNNSVVKAESVDNERGLSVTSAGTPVTQSALCAALLSSSTVTSSLSSAAIASVGPLANTTSSSSSQPSTQSTNSASTSDEKLVNTPPGDSSENKGAASALSAALSSSAQSNGANHSSTVIASSTSSSSSTPSDSVVTRNIPRLIPGASGDAGMRESGGSGAQQKLQPDTWSPAEVCYFLTINDCGLYCESFSRKGIDGASFLTLSKEQIVNLTGMKVGPSLKIHDLIQQLKQQVGKLKEKS